MKSRTCKACGADSGTYPYCDLDCANFHRTTSFGPRITDTGWPQANKKETVDRGKALWGEDYDP